MAFKVLSGLVPANLFNLILYLLTIPCILLLPFSKHSPNPFNHPILDLVSAGWNSDFLPELLFSILRPSQIPT